MTVSNVLMLAIAMLGVAELLVLVTREPEPVLTVTVQIAADSHDADLARLASAGILTLTDCRRRSYDGGVLVIQCQDELAAKRRPMTQQVAGGAPD